MWKLFFFFFFQPAGDPRTFLLGEKNFIRKTKLTKNKKERRVCASAAPPLAKIALWRPGQAQLLPTFHAKCNAKTVDMSAPCLIGPDTNQVCKRGALVQTLVGAAGRGLCATAAPGAAAGFPRNMAATMLPHSHWRHTFSAFWLRSSVVSVLISLISDTQSLTARY